MKKWICLLLAVATILSFASCKKKKTTPDPDSNGTSSETGGEKSNPKIGDGPVEGPIVDFIPAG